MIIAVSGAQGQGKSTVLKDLESQGHKVVPNKTSRTILAEWNLTLNEVNKYAPLTKNFQEEILTRHIAYMQPASQSDELHFAERSFADIFTYCLFQLGSFNEYNSWVEEYFFRCQEAQNIFSSVIYLSGRSYTPEEDGVRSTNVFFSSAVDLLIKSHLEAFKCPNTKLVYIHESSHYERIHRIQQLITN